MSKIVTNNRTILIHDSLINTNLKKDIDFFKKKYSNMMIYSGNFSNLYNGFIYNPPFFNIIIYTCHIKKENTFNTFLMLLNMLLSDGFLIILNTDLELKNYKLKNYELKNYIIIKKNKPTIHILNNKYRIIDLMIIGVQKGGTSAAMTNLEKHPDINIHYGEIHYYENDWIKYNLSEYKSKFDYTKKIVGEKDPNIIYMPYLFPLIQQINPYIKMILFLRNPIDRAYSAWYMFSTKYVNGQDTLKSFEEKIINELEYRIDEPLNLRIANSHYLQRGLYFKQIKELLKYFPRENIYICLSEKVINDMDNEYKKIYDFLDISYPKQNINYEKRFIGQYNLDDKKNDISSSFYKKLVKYYQEDVKNLEKEILGYKTNWFTKK